MGEVLEKGMPPDVNIYGLTIRRNLETINQFLETFIDRAASEERGDEELMLVPLDGVRQTDDFEAYDWEPARTLSHAIQRGLDYPHRSFALYLPAKDPNIDQAILKFTTDDQLILGVSIDIGEVQFGNGEQAKCVLNTLYEDYHCYLGLIIAEMPPPDDEQDFRDTATSPWVIDFQDFSH